MSLSTLPTTTQQLLVALRCAFPCAAVEFSLHRNLSAVAFTMSTCVCVYTGRYLFVN